MEEKGHSESVKLSNEVKAAISSQYSQGESKVTADKVERLKARRRSLDLIEQVPKWDRSLFRTTKTGTVIAYC